MPACRDHQRGTAENAAPTSAGYGYPAGLPRPEASGRRRCRRCANGVPVRSERNDRECRPGRRAASAPSRPYVMRAVEVQRSLAAVAMVTEAPSRQARGGPARSRSARSGSSPGMSLGSPNEEAGPAAVVGSSGAAIHSRRWRWQADPREGPSECCCQGCAKGGGDPPPPFSHDDSGGGQRQ